MDIHVILVSSIVLSAFGVVHGQVLSCNQTPYPVTCHYFIEASKLPASNEMSGLSFRDTTLRVTLEQAYEAYRVIYSMDMSSVEMRAKVAWGDCLELYEDNVHQLNQTIFTSSTLDKPPTIDDVQTYLSAAIANDEICKNGFMDLNLASHLESFPSVLTNFSELLINALAINKASPIPSSPPVSRSPSIGNRRLLANGFPLWVSMTERKLLQSTTSATTADLVVAMDGTGDYKTISEAINASKKLRSGTKRFIIYVKKGIYNENVVVTNKMKNLMLIGDGIDATVVTSNKNVQDGSTTYRSATFGVSGDGFIAKGITFENTAGPQKHQAVAFRSGSDLSVFYECSFKGYQDTLYVYSKRQFYKECDIYGTIDFIFGDAAVVFQSCGIYARKPMSNQANTITAQARSDPNENTGIVIHNSIIDAAPDLKPVQGSVRTFLGRPWHQYSRSVVVKSAIGGLVDPAGWAPWDGDFGINTLYYGEYMNTGPGADTSHRVKWPGYHLITSPAEAGKFSVQDFLAGDAWIPATGVPFTAGL
uniref:Pectinesterase n=1 Tax=Opuntia streptacantha TaxID=393608 RepID=A0A7C9ATM5_OPUST